MNIANNRRGYLVYNWINLITSIHLNDSYTAFPSNLYGLRYMDIITINSAWNL